VRDVRFLEKLNLRPNHNWPQKYSKKLMIKLPYLLDIL